MTHEPTTTDARYDRRTVLKAGAAAATTAAVGAAPASATGGADASLKSWLEDVGNFDGIVDETGTDEVTIRVGADGNNGAFAFSPAAVRVDPGTTVVWEWTGDGGSHNVVEKDGAYESDLLGGEGDTFEYTFEEEGVSPYYCGPHKSMGMKAAVVVGDVDVEVPETGSEGAGGTGEDGDSSDAGESTESVDYGGWFDDVGNFDGTVDETGSDRVTVEVGTEGNDGAFAFSPAAVRVDPGTTVVWDWTGDGGSHNVVADDGSYESDLLGSAGATFEHTFEEEGVSKYYCAPHKAMGMKGAVVVGTGDGAAAESGDGAAASGGDSSSELWLLGLAGALVSALLSPFLFGAFLFAKDDDSGDGRGKRHGQHP